MTDTQSALWAQVEVTRPDGGKTKCSARTAYHYLGGVYEALVASREIKVRFHGDGLWMYRALGPIPTLEQMLRADGDAS